MARKINWFWKCEFEDSDGNTEWKMLSASTTVGAKERAFELGRNLGLKPKYETITAASDSEIKALKKKIKEKVNEKLNKNLVK